jgi:hypothetical protein
MSNKTWIYISLAALGVALYLYYKSSNKTLGALAGATTQSALLNSMNLSSESGVTKGTLDFTAYGPAPFIISDAMTLS